MFWLRVPAKTIFFISRDACRDSITRFFGACFVGCRTMIARYVAKWGITQMCQCKLSTKVGYCTKKTHVRNIFARDSRAGNGCAKFMPIKIPRFTGGGVGFFEGGGGSMPILLLWARGLF